MSYCVHCGVELAESEKRCPLCNTEVIDPAAISVQEIHYPYPAEIQYPSVSLRRGASVFISIALAIPLLCCLIADFTTDFRLSWSFITAGGLFLIFFLFLFPNLFRRPKVWLFLLLDIPVVWVFLCVICIILRGDWWLMPALPLTLLTGAMLIGNYLMCSSKKATFGLKCIILQLSVVLFSICVQIVIELYLRSVITLSWSIYIAVSGAVLSVVTLVIDRLYHLSEKIRKKIFL